MPCPKILAPLLILSALPFAVATALADDSAVARSRHIIHLASPPTALFEGFAADAEVSKRLLKPTHAATAGRLRLDVAAPEVKAYRSHLAAEQASFERAAADVLGRALAPDLRFDLSLNAVVVELAPVEVAELEKLPMVSRVEPDFVRRTQSDVGPAWVNAPAVWQGAAGIASRGEGVVIGVIDTGINATHPAFAQVGPIDGHVHTPPRALSTPLCATAMSAPCNGKLIGVRDFTTGSASAEPNNGLDVDGHGSHVAAIALGNTLAINLTAGNQDIQRQLSGVAPHAHLISYKACEMEADCAGSWLLGAIEAAIADGVDVINYSIGGDPRDPWSSSDALALLAAREAGIVAVVAAGNDGPGLGTVTAPGNSPWVISVANSSHNRSIGNRLLDFAGGSAVAPLAGSLLGAGDTEGFGPARIVVPQDFPDCGVTDGLGLGADNRPDGSTNPWAGNSNRFNGEIVVCLRGTQARIAKGDNVRRAGAGGMILLNTVGDGESIAADRHALPATHLGFAAGQALLQWLNAGGESARIEGARLVEDTSLADRMSADSGRGPISYGGVMLPSIAAPGTSILAAAGTGNGVATRSGTSMAAPHVAGAAALLRAVKPGWRVDQIQSALMSTGRDGLRREDAVSPARRIDMGAGALDVAAAVQAGLALEVGGSQFRAARPAQGGQPRDLNLPGLLHERCFERCSLTRTVRDLVGGGRWRASVELAEGVVQISPAEFEMSAGGSQRLSLNIDLRDGAGIGRWLDGRVRLSRISGPGSVVDSVLPLSVYADPGGLPTEFAFEVEADSGFVEIDLGGLAGLRDLQVETGALSTPIDELRFLAQDPTPSAAYDDIGAGSFYSRLRLPAATSGAPRTFVLDATAGSSSARNVNLFVGIDYNTNGRPDEGEQQCASNGSGASERCRVELTQTGSAYDIWVMVQNAGAGIGGSDDLRLQAVLLDPQTSPGRDAVATAPARIPSREPFRVRLAWDAPDLLPGERRVSLLSLRASPDAEPFAHIPVELRRTGVNPAPRLLASGVEQRLRLPAGGAHEQLFIDVPPGSRLLDIQASGPAGLSLHAARISFPAQPQIAAAPARSTAVASAEGQSISLRIENPQLQPGRWYLTPTNAGSTAAELRITATIERNAVRPTPRFGAYYNPERSGSGVFLFGFGSSWGMLWYTYLEDGTPTWYIGSAPAPSLAHAQWSVALSRYTWNDRTSRATEVGRATLSLSGSQSMQYAFSIDGGAGSEPMRWIGGDRCAVGSFGALDLNGLWYDVLNSGFGYSIDTSPSLETVGLFFYDDHGVARWSFGSATPFGSGPLAMLQFSGACPLCAYSPPLTSSIGGLVVVYPGAQQGSISATLDLAPPLSGSWDRTHPLDRLSDPTGCPP